MLHGSEAVQMSFYVDSPNIIQFPKMQSNRGFVQNCRRGEHQEVFPLKKMEHIAAISNYFLGKGQYRDLLIFTLGINIGLRAGDLVSLKTEDLFNPNGTLRYIDDISDTTDGICVVEEKTTKRRTFFLNEACREAIFWYKAKTGETFRTGSYIFKSREGGHIEVDTYRKILKEAAEACGIKQNIGTHTLRKSFGYWQFMQSQGDVRVLSMIQRLFGHSSQAITLRYIGLTDEENKQMYKGLNLRTIPADTQ